MTERMLIRELARLVEHAIEVGRIQRADWVSELNQLPASQEFGAHSASREELALVYARRSRRQPHNQSLAAISRELDSHDGESVLLGYVELASFVGHVFLDVAAANLLGAAMKPRRT
jgi:hypothetical protein